MSDHSNLSALAEKNTALLEKLNFDPLRDDPFELDNPVTFRESGLFTDAAIDSIFHGTDYAPAETQSPIAANIGMLLVRPDMIQVSSQVETFIRQRFTLRDVATTTVDPEMYWAMYGDALVDRETRQSRLTRAAIYVNSLCRLFVFEQPDLSDDAKPTADEVTARLKGRQGVPQAGTLRGDIVYHEAIAQGFHTLTDPYTARVADPFGAYRKIVREHTTSPCHTLTYPLLFFTGVGIHVPDFKEIQRDLPLLTSRIPESAHAAE